MSDPSAKNLDTGEALKVETLKGDAISRAGIDIGEAVAQEFSLALPPFPRGPEIRVEPESEPWKRMVGPGDSAQEVTKTYHVAALQPVTKADLIAIYQRLVLGQQGQNLVIQARGANYQKQPFAPVK